MTISGWRKIRTAGIGALVAMAVVFAFDLLQPSPVMAEVIERHETYGIGGQDVTVSWTGEDGVTHTRMLLAPPEYVDENSIPVVVDTQFPYVHDGWVSLDKYLMFGALGLLVGWAATSLRSQPYHESPIRETTTGAGV